MTPRHRRIRDAKLRRINAGLSKPDDARDTEELLATVDALLYAAAQIYLVARRRTNLGATERYAAGAAALFAELAQRDDAIDEN